MSNVARLALGTVQFGLDYGLANKTGQVSLQSVQSILSKARSSGINLLDTAVAYGESQSVLGEAGIVGWKVVTKLPALPPNLSDVRSWIENHLSRSLEELQVSSVYGLLCHQASDLWGSDARQIVETLESLKQEGRTKKIGVSVYSPEDLNNLPGFFRPGIVQLPFNILDRRFLYSGSLVALRARGVEIHARSIFLQGLLLQTKSERAGYFQRWDDLWKRWDEYLSLQPASAHSICLWFALSIPEIDQIVVGLDSINQLSELIETAERSATVEEWPDFDSNDEDLILPMRWRLQ